MSGANFYSINQSQTKTEFLHPEDGHVALCVEDDAAKQICRVTHGKDPVRCCEILCNSVEDVKRCRALLVRSLAQYAPNGYAKHFFDEDISDILSAMGETGFYAHFPLDDGSNADRLAALRKQFAEFKESRLGDIGLMNGRIEMSEPEFSLASFEGYANLFEEVFAPVSTLIQGYSDAGNAIDIWLFQI